MSDDLISLHPRPARIIAIVGRLRARRDVETLISSEPDIAEACKRGAALLYRDYILKKGLDPMELQGKRSAIPMPVIFSLQGRQGPARF